MSATRVAVIGLGASAFEHLARLKDRTDVEVAGICDDSPTLTRAMAERFDVRVANTEALPLLDEVAPEVVHVLTPPRAHRDLVLAALERGAHVLVDAPAAPSAAAWSDMRTAAVSARRMLVEAYDSLFTPALRTAIAEVGPLGRLGDLAGVDVAFNGLMGDGAPDPYATGVPGAALRSVLTHPVSIAVALLGPPAEVHAVRPRSDPSAPAGDEVRVLLATGHAWATLGVSRQQRPPRFTVALEGTGGRAEVDILSNRLVVMQGDAGAVTGAAREGLARLEGAATLVGRALRGGKDRFAGLDELLDAFYRSVRTGAPPPVTLQQIDAVAHTVSAALDAGELACA